MLALLVAATLGACPPAEVKEAHILQLPSEDEISEAYPLKARQFSQNGSVAVACDVQANGVLHDCKVMSEEPGGWGFGEAAAAVFNRMTISPKTECGKAVAGTFKTRFTFKMWEPPAEAAKLPPSAEALALARRLIASQRDGGYFDDYTTNSLQKAALGGQAGSPDERLTAFEIARDVWAVGQEHIMESAAEYYAKNVSVEDLRAWVAFAESPAGVRMQTFNREHQETGIYSTEELETIAADARARFCAKTKSCSAFTAAPSLSPQPPK